MMSEIATALRNSELDIPELKTSIKHVLYKPAGGNRKDDTEYETPISWWALEGRRRVTSYIRCRVLTAVDNDLNVSQHNWMFDGFTGLARAVTCSSSIGHSSPPTSFLSSTLLFPAAIGICIRCLYLWLVFTLQCTGFHSRGEAAGGKPQSCNEAHQVGQVLTAPSVVKNHHLSRHQYGPAGRARPRC